MALDMAFMDRGLCVGDPNPNRWQPHAGQLALDALKVCAACPVRDECLAYALERPELGGIWGGTRARERDALAGRAPRRNSYSPETRQRALDLFAELRPNYRSDTAAHRAIAAELGIGDHDTVRRWREKPGTEALGQAA